MSRRQFILSQDESIWILSHCYFLNRWFISLWKHHIELISSQCSRGPGAVVKAGLNGVLGQLCAHIGWTGPWEPPEDGEMNEMTLPSKHMIVNSSSGGLRRCTLPLGHRGFPQYCMVASDRGKSILFLEIWRPEWGSNPRSPTFQAGSFNHCTSEPPFGASNMAAT